MGLRGGKRIFARRKKRLENSEAYDMQGIVHNGRPETGTPGRGNAQGSLPKAALRARRAGAREANRKWNPQDESRLQGMMGKVNPVISCDNNVTFGRQKTALNSDHRDASAIWICSSNLEIVLRASLVNAGETVRAFTASSG